MPELQTTADTRERNRWDEVVYSLADFADAGVNVDHPLTARRIPVLRDCYPGFRFHVALVIGGPSYMPREHDAVEPEPFEVDQLCVYLEKHMSYYNDSYRARVSSRGQFDVDGTVNTHTFRKHPTDGWQYNMASWRSGPTWAPYQPTEPLTLEALLDRVNTLGSGPPSQKWLDLKAASGAFPDAPSSAPQAG